MNAGAWGGETWRHVIEVDVLDRRGLRHTRTPADYAIGYRSVKGPQDEWFIRARLEFERAPGVNTRSHSRIARQAQADPAHRRVELRLGIHQPAGRTRSALIESAGLKGFRIGDASVSDKHANFIINHGSARAADVEAVIVHVQRTVEKIHGISLHTEVRIVGEPA
jgi:UDP-N-acetylmuramate dehydrogenase